jgi:hypothetical protein
VEAGVPPSLPALDALTFQAIAAAQAHVRLRLCPGDCGRDSLIPVSC